jgi:glycosyltransferase involved in cell wall biosynthesis
MAYFAILLEGSQTGAAKKVDDQVRIWMNLGYEVRVYVLTSKRFEFDWSRAPYYTTYIDDKGPWKLIIRYRVVKEILKTRVDVLYIRDSFPFLIPKKMGKTEVVLEVQSKLQTEVFNRSYFLGFISIVLDVFYLKRFDKFVFVSNEISRTKRFQRYKRDENSIIISNGVLLERVPILKECRASVTPELLFLGQEGQSWHGVSQIIEIAHQLPKFHFHIVGIAANQLRFPPNVFFYGHLPQEEYLQIASKCCAAVGTLNLRAKQMREGSSLKLREYLALGLPSIIRYADTDFTENQNFILQLPDNNEPITNFIKIIEEFVLEWRSSRVPRELISHIDMNRKETVRLDFFFDSTR